MKKIALVVAVAMMMVFVAAVASFAWINNGGVRPVYEWVVPKINPNNPAVVFDGHIDLEGEWYGALDIVLDFTDDGFDDELTLWTSDVWGAGIGYNSFDELDDYWKCTMHNLFMYDDNGVYWCTYVPDSKTFAGNGAINPEHTEFWLKGTRDSYDGIRPHNNQNMWAVGTDPDVIGGYIWLNVAVSATELQCWGEDYGLMVDDNLGFEWAKEIKCGSYCDGGDSNGDGYYEWAVEFYMPWEIFTYPAAIGIDGWENENVINGEVGQGFRCGIINRQRCTNDPDQPYIQYTNAYGWNNFDVYYLGKDMVDDSPKKAEAVVAETAEVEEVEEVETVETVETVEEVEEVEEVAEETTTATTTTSTKTTKNTKTADSSAVFYALAAVAAVGALCIFKRK